MGTIISIANQKGGIGKSTTAQSLAAGLAFRKYRILLIDFDPKLNTTETVGETDKEGYSVYDVLTGRADITDAIQLVGPLDFIPSSRALSGIDFALKDIGREYKLQEVMTPVKANYDFIIIDTPPALGTLTINAMTASDSVILTAQADVYNLQGIANAYETIATIKKYTNKSLSLKGILLTRHNDRSILSRDMRKLIEDTSKLMGTFVYNTIIRECIAIKESQATKQDIFSYSPKSNASIDYNNFINEFLEREENNNNNNKKSKRNHR